jgi:16S rRNA G1207 methylase RsmC
VTGDHYFSASPRAHARPTEIEFEVAGREYRLQALAGVFSAGRLDPGTAVLLRKAELPAPWATGTLLDLGCGYGPIACVLATVATRAYVYAVDVNERAVDATRANAAALGLSDRVHASHPDGVPVDCVFDQIWSNPPIRVGKDELHAILSRWLPRLAPGGTAWLVAGKHLGGDSLQRWLQQQGWDVARHASQQGFRVLRVARADNSRDEAPPSPENA